MDKNYVKPFIKAIGIVLGQFGIGEISNIDMQVKEQMILENDFTGYVGFVGEINGNLACNFSEETGKKIASAMMGGMPVEELDEMAKSALAEFTNILAGNTSTLFFEQKLTMNVTTPSFISGKNVYFILSFHEAVTVFFDTSIGKMAMSLSLEM